MSFNVLIDKWVPVEQNGEFILASWFDLVTGKVEAERIRHPREDFEVFSVMLGSALGQALCPAKDRDELKARIEKGKVIDAQILTDIIQPILSDFDLVCGFMQGIPEENEELAKDNPTDRLIPEVSGTSAPLLSRFGLPLEWLCGPCAVLGLFGMQAFCGQGGRGYRANVRSDSPVTTLIAPGTFKRVRSTFWANTLSSKYVESFAWGKEPSNPWRQQMIEKPGTQIGLVEGLFWKPRLMTLEKSETSELCPICSVHGVVYKAVRYRSNQSRGEGYYLHPLSPWIERESPQTQRAITGRPVWTGLADMLSLPQKDPQKNSQESDELPRAAPVVEQWVSDQGLNMTPLPVEVFWYSFANATLDQRFRETYSLQMQVRDREFVNSARGNVRLATETLRLLRESLMNATRRNERAPTQGAWNEEATARFWKESEEPFWTAMRAELNENIEDIDSVRQAFCRSLRDLALVIFDAHTNPSCFDESRQKTVAQARVILRKRLSGVLFPNPKAPQTQSETKETGSIEAVS